MMFHVNFVATKMEMVICFGSVPFHLYCMLVSSLSLLLLCLRIVVDGLVAYSGMAGLLVLVVVMRGVLWAASFGQLACLELERRLGACPVDSSGHWTPPCHWDADDIALEMLDHPNIWTDGSRDDLSSVGGVEVAGAGFYLPAAEVAFESAVWGVAEEYGDARLERCRAFVPVPGVLQTVQRTEFWGATVALQAYRPCHLGDDNLNVARTFDRLLDRDCLAKPLIFVKDGEFGRSCSVHDPYSRSGDG